MQNAILLQNILTSNGFKTLACGGFVRDYLLKREWRDIDLATIATPDKVKEILSNQNINTFDTGLKHGTVTAVLDNRNYEITTLRKDIKCYGRKASVEFTNSFEKDAQRRDFTINALFMDLNTKEIYDYIGGKDDLENGILRFVGNPDDRIKEDYLRILRLFRFKLELGFNCSHKDFSSLSYLWYLSGERIREEIFKLLIGDFIDVDNDTIFLDAEIVLTTIIPELDPTIEFLQNCDNHCYDVMDHTLFGLVYLKQFKDPILSFAHLLHDVAKPFCHSVDENGIDHFYGHEKESARVAGHICDRLKLSNHDKKRIQFLIENHMYLHLNSNKKSLRRMIGRCESFGNRNIIYDLLNIIRADHKGMKQEEDWDTLDNYFKNTIDKLIEEMEYKSPLDGHEIMALDVKEGRKIGEVKNMLRNMVIDGKLDSQDKETSKKLVKEYYCGR